MMHSSLLCRDSGGSGVTTSLEAERSPGEVIGAAQSSQALTEAQIGGRPGKMKDAAVSEKMALLETTKSFGKAAENPKRLG